MTEEIETFEEDRKLFVGGLPQEATQDELKVCHILRNEKKLPFTSISGIL